MPRTEDAGPAPAIVDRRLGGLALAVPGDARRRRQRPRRRRQFSAASTTRPTTGAPVSPRTSRSPTSARTAIDGWTLTYSYAGNQKLQQRLERHLVAVRQGDHRQERLVQRDDRRRRHRHHRRAVHLQRHQRRADRLRGQRHQLRRRPPAADHRADQPGRGRDLHRGRRRPARRHRGRRGRRDDQQGGVLRRHHAARHRHHRAVHALGCEA